MAGSLTDYAERATLDWLLGGAAPTRPVTRYLGLFTTASDDTGAGTEVSGNGYARQAITFGAAATVSGVSGSSNSNAPTFTAAGGDWGTVSWFAVFDALTGGNMLFPTQMDTARQVKDGDTLSFPVGKITLQQD